MNLIISLLLFLKKKFCAIPAFYCFIYCKFTNMKYVILTLSVYKKPIIAVFLNFTSLSSWWSCLKRGALINVDAPGCGTSVVRGPTGTSRKVFILGYSP